MDDHANLTLSPRKRPWHCQGMTHLMTLSGHAVPPFAFGAMQFGGTADERISRALFDASREAGIRHFDTAHVYNNGHSETILGQCAAQHETLYIATKVGYTGGAGRANISAQFQTSLTRLKRTWVDLLYLHRWDENTPLEETFETLAGFQQAGQIRHIGVSNYAAWQVMKAQRVAERLGTRIDVLQPMYNLAKRQAEVDLLPMCRSEGILPVSYSPLGGGLLTGKYAAGGTGRLVTDTRYAARYGQAAMHDAAAGLCALATEIGTDPATLAVAWVAAHPARPVPILSARSVAQLRPSLEGMRYPLDGALHQRISTLMPAPPPATDRLEEV